MHLGPDELLVAAEIGVSRDDHAGQVATAIHQAEAAIGDAVPIAKIIYLEPDVYGAPPPSA